MHLSDTDSARDGVNRTERLQTLSDTTITDKYDALSRRRLVRNYVQRRPSFGILAETGFQKGRTLRYIGRAVEHSFDVCSQINSHD